MFTTLSDAPTATAPGSSGPLRQLFVDFNAFFASVEQHLRPELRGLPIAVVPVAAESTCCIAASYPAKRCGVKTGTRVSDARRLCPDIRIIEARPSEYVRMHERLVAAVESCLPVGTVLSIDEMSCELPVNERHWEAALERAHLIKRTLARDIGPTLTCSIGIAANTFLAKTASDMHKPDGLVIILPEDLPEILYPLALRDLCGVGARMEKRLRAYGIETVEALWSARPEDLRAVWGGIEGDRFYARLHGVEVHQPPSSQQSIGHSHVLPPHLRQAEGARAVLHRLTQKAAIRLRAAGLLAGGLVVHARWIGGGSWRADRTFTPTSDTAHFLRVISSLWDQRTVGKQRPLAVGLNLIHLRPAAMEPISLFGEREKSEAFHRAVDTLNRRLGKHTLTYAGALGALEHAPMRIAFTRIPDLETEA